MQKTSTNILVAIANIINYREISKDTSDSQKNRANAMGDELEIFIKNSFACIEKKTTAKESTKIYNKYFSYCGNSNNPPDFLIRNGDAIEVKKLEYQFSELQLNSSFPKDKLYASDPKISQACAEAEEWDEKDIFYCVGWVKDKKIAQILFIQGSCYAADHSTYQKIEDRITVALEEDKDTEYSETKELARVNNVDPLGVTNLRVRGMWLLRNPGKFFEDFLGTNEFDFRVAAIMLDEKYSDYKESSRQIIENIESIILEDIEIPNPNNPAKLLKAKLIKYEE